MDNYIKKLAIILVIFIVACAANDPVTADKLNLARKLVDTQFSLDVLRPKVDKISADLFQGISKKILFLYCDKNNQQLSEYAVKDVVSKYMSVDIFKTYMAEYYAQQYSSDEMQRLIEYLSSSGGKKLTYALNRIMEETTFEAVEHTSIFGKKTSRIEANYKKDLQEYNREFMDSLSDSEKQEFMSFSMGGLGNKYRVSFNGFGNYVKAKTREKIQNTNFEQEFRKTTESLVACNNRNEKAIVGIEKLHYEQQLPLWFDTFKKTPQEAKALGLSGAADLFIKIDREGNILDYKIKGSGSNKILEDALLQMVKDAKRAPAVPKDYHPDKKTLSYLIKFKFGDDGVVGK